MIRNPDLILAGRLVDGTGTAPRDRQALLLRDGRIEAVLLQQDLTRTQREGRAVLDLGEATVLPGLIDSHVHVTFNAGPNHDVVRRALVDESDPRLALRGIANAQAHLARGVTTIRDVGGRGFVTFAVRDAIRDGLVVGPRMKASGPAITTLRGHLNYLGAIANNANELRRRSREVLEAGADFVKLCASGGIMTAESDPMESQYTTEELRGAVEVADAHHTLVAAHVLSSESLVRCVEAGVRSIEHCMWQDSPGAFSFRPGVAAVMREKGIIAGLTFAGLSQARYLENVMGQTGGEDLGVWRHRLEHRYAAEREMVASGVRYVLHSDAGVRATPFGTFWLIPATACYELQISPLEAIRAVTATAAELLGVAEEVGTLESGKRADLLVVDDDPSVKIEALSAPRAVLLNGEVVAEHGELRSGGAVVKT